jgi:hypothetical protein
MEQRDRIASLGLLAAAALVWILAGIVFTRLSPEGSLAVQLSGAGLLGLALGLSVVPLAWLAVFARRRRIAYRGEWVRAARRGVWVGLVVALLVALRTQHALSLPLALFVVVLVAFVEASLTVER